MRQACNKLGAVAVVVTQNLGGDDITEQHKPDDVGFIIEESLHKELELLLLLVLLAPLLLLLLLLLQTLPFVTVIVACPQSCFTVVEWGLHTLSVDDFSEFDNEFHADRTPAPDMTTDSRLCGSTPRVGPSSLSLASSSTSPKFSFTSPPPLSVIDQFPPPSKTPLFGSSLIFLIIKFLLSPLPLISFSLWMDESITSDRPESGEDTLLKE